MSGTKSVTLCAIICENCAQIHPEVLKLRLFNKTKEPKRRTGRLLRRLENKVVSRLCKRNKFGDT
jgi:hypothetical protein